MLYYFPKGDNLMAESRLCEHSRLDGANDMLKLAQFIERALLENDLSAMNATLSANSLLQGIEHDSNDVFRTAREYLRAQLYLARTRREELLGQFAIQTARLSGCFPVIALDFNEKRRNIALASGADAAFSPDDPELESKIKALTNGKGVDSVIEVTGNPQAVVQGLKLTAPFGRFSLVGCSRSATENIDFYNLVHRPGISIIGAHNMARPLHDRRPGVWTMPEDMATLLRFMAAGRLSSRQLHTMTADPAEAPGIYDRLFVRDPELLGVVFDWKNY
ncbi:MAG: hypothetical protein E7045_10160 [Lentisphaerae bacterium]|nr:hypothetical protein [Lentisphaerota bacterium]